MVRGVRALLKATAPGKLAKAGKFACFRARTDSNRPTGPKLRGITKLLTKRLYSSATLPSTGSWRGGAWSGANGGLRRGRAVDAQVSRLANASALMRKHSRMLKLTRLCFNALAYHKLVPVGSQRVVIDRAARHRHSGRRRVHAGQPRVGAGRAQNGVWRRSHQRRGHVHAVADPQGQGHATSTGTLRSWR